MIEWSCITQNEIVSFPKMFVSIVLKNIEPQLGINIVKWVESFNCRTKKNMPTVEMAVSI